MGIAVRTNVNMPLDLEESLWKYLTQEEGHEMMTTTPTISSEGSSSGSCRVHDDDDGGDDYRTRARIEFVKRAEAIRKVSKWTLGSGLPSVASSLSSLNI